MAKVSKYDKHIKNNIQKIAWQLSMGSTEEEIYNGLNISKKLWNSYKDQYPEFNEACSKDITDTIMFVEKSLLTEVKKGNIAAMKLFLETKGGYIKSEKLLDKNEKNPDNIINGKKDTSFDEIDF